MRTETLKRINGDIDAAYIAVRNIRASRLTTDEVRKECTAVLSELTDLRNDICGILLRRGRKGRHRVNKGI